MCMQSEVPPQNSFSFLSDHSSEYSSTTHFTVMAFSSFLKGFALLALLALDVSAANSEATRRLRVDEAGGETRRRLQSKWGVWLAVIKTNLAHLPIEDRLYEQLKRIKEKMDNAK
ncbi:hypothetical protein PRIC1_004767 [Phytophthora ramorum]|uniref:uncharacterized protein n=1 Tax=Phytophthora ramorum TaxID=164328 RepID=UPI0030A0F526|nr:hypothetical protein KRP23_4514 [Phytophthora ramorum]